jgi:hypothetical protein
LIRGTWLRLCPLLWVGDLGVGGVVVVKFAFFAHFLEDFGELGIIGEDAEGKIASNLLDRLDFWFRKPFVNAGGDREDFVGCDRGWRGHDGARSFFKIQFNSIRRRVGCGEALCR